MSSKKIRLNTNSTTHFVVNRWESERRKIQKHSKKVQDKIREIQKNYDTHQKRYSEYLEKSSFN